MDAAAFQAGLAWRQQGEQKKERAKAEATETQSLRKLMSIYDPENKDTYTSMGLGDLRGSAQAIAIKQHMDELQRKEEERAAERDFYGMLGSAPGGVGPVAPVNGNRMLSAAAQSGYRLPPQVLTQMMHEGEDGSGFKFDPSQIVDLEQYGLPGQVYAPTSKGGGQIRTRWDANGGGIEEATDEEGNVYKFMTNPKTGARTILSRPKGRKEIPAAFFEKLSDREGLAADMQRNRERMNYRDDQVPATEKDKNAYRASTKQKAEAQRSELENLFSTMEAEGYGKPETWQALRKQYGLNSEANSGKAAPAAKPAQGGYKIGTKYSGLTYIGGDPKQESSWQK